MENIPVKVPGDTHFSTEFNSYVGEDKNLCLDVNITLDSADSHQLGQVNATYASCGDYYIDSGVVNALNLVSAQYNFQTPQQYYDGMRVRCLPAATNTGAAFINVASLGNIAIKLPDGVSDPDSGDIVQGVMTDFYYSFSLGVMILAGSVSSPASFPQNYLTGFQANYSVNTQFTVAQGQCTTSDNEHVVTTNAPWTKLITANWTPGNGNGGFPSALVLLQDTFYKFFIISKPDGTFDFGFDTDPNAVNLLADAGPSGFTRARRLHYLKTDPLATTITEMDNTGDYYTYYSTINDINIGYAGGNNLTNVALSIPVDSTIIARYISTYLGQSNNAISSGFTWTTSPFSTDATAGFPNSISNQNSASTLFNAGGAIYAEFPTSDGTVNVIMQTTGFTLSNLYIMTFGWIDSRGKY